jgi:uncharacterized membrane protein
MVPLISAAASAAAPHTGVALLLADEARLADAAGARDAALNLVSFHFHFKLFINLRNKRGREKS